MTEKEERSLWSEAEAQLDPLPRSGSSESSCFSFKVSGCPGGEKGLEGRESLEAISQKERALRIKAHNKERITPEATGWNNPIWVHQFSRGGALRQSQLC